MEPKRRPSYFSTWASTFRLFDDYLLQQGVSAQELCINFVANLDEVDNVVIGVETAEQLSDIGKCSGAGSTPIPIPESLSCTDPKLLDPFLWKI